MGCILIGEKLFDARAGEKSGKRLFVFITPRSTSKTRPEFTKNDKGNHDIDRPPDHMHSFRCPFTEILVTIAIHLIRRIINHGDQKENNT